MPINIYSSSSSLLSLPVTPQFEPATGIDPTAYVGGILVIKREVQVTEGTYPCAVKNIPIVCMPLTEKPQKPQVFKEIIFY